MTYLYVRMDPGHDMTDIFEPFEASFLARRAPETMALFHKRADDGSHGYLIPATTLTAAPEIAAIADWVEVDVAQDLGWGLLVGHSDAWDHHDVPRRTHDK